MVFQSTCCTAAPLHVRGLRAWQSGVAADAAAPLRNIRLPQALETAEEPAHLLLKESLHLDKQWLHLLRMLDLQTFKQLGDIVLQVFDHLLDLSASFLCFTTALLLLEVQHKFMGLAYLLVGADQLFVRNRLRNERLSLTVVDCADHLLDLGSCITISHSVEVRTNLVAVLKGLHARTLDISNAANK